MKKLLFVLMMLLVASAASAMKLPDPVITVTEGDEYYTVDVAVEGDYELRVFCGNLEIETPYAIERLDVDKEYIILAFAQLYNEEGWSYSNVVEYDLYVPAKEEMPVPGPYPPGWIYFDVIEGDEYYTVLAYCEEDGFTVQLWSNGEPVDNPYIIERSPEGDMEYVITACSQAEGYDIVTATMTLVVPALDDPQPGPYPPNWTYMEVTEGDQFYTVTAYCYEDCATVSLYRDEEEVENPCIIERTHEDQIYRFTAVGHCDGYEDSDSSMDLLIPALDEPLPGDMNCDGEVTIADVNAVIDAILSQSSNEMYDFDGDGEVTVSDVTALIAFIMSGH